MKLSHLTLQTRYQESGWQDLLKHTAFDSSCCLLIAVILGIPQEPLLQDGFLLHCVVAPSSVSTTSHIHKPKEKRYQEL